MITSTLSALNSVDLLAELLRLGSREGRDSVPEHHPELTLAKDFFASSVEIAHAQYQAKIDYHILSTFQTGNL
ncbi:unnamed protein product [Fusarium graminearum]|nr:unnamed protein product [Fusarium graminearum]